MNKILSVYLITFVLTIIYSCDNDKFLFDIDGNKYKTVIIGEQKWMAQNLNVSKFNNGDIILEVKSKIEWDSAINKKISAWCYYNFDNENGKIYGKIYNYYAVIDHRRIAPNGWHIPNIKEWEQLIKYLSNEQLNIDVGIKMKSKIGWNEKGNGTNESGFNGLPGGGIDCYSEFKNLGDLGHWWLDKKEDNIINMALCNKNGGLGISGDENFDCDFETGVGSQGMSIRCIENK
jgi:uncharacterized protein (TIGR02145 family)